MSRFLLRMLAALLVLLVVAYSAVSWYLASQVTEAERVALERDPSAAGLDYESVSFAPRGDADEIVLKGWHIRAPGSRGTVLIVHGLDRNRADTEIGYLEVARRLHDRGFSSLLFDLRGHGESGGDQVSGGLFERKDLLGAFDYLVEQGVPPERIGALGFSLGAAVALLAAPEEPRLQAVIADSAFADLSDLIVQETRRRTSLPGWMVPALVPGMVQAGKLVYDIDISRVTPKQAAADLPYPLLIIHSRSDERIPVEHARRIRDAAPNPDTKLWLAPDSEHAHVFRSHPQEYVDRITRYLAQRLGPEQRAGSSPSADEAVIRHPPPHRATDPGTPALRPCSSRTG